MLYFDRNSLPSEREQELGCKREEDLDAMLAKCDVVIVNTPLTDQTRGLFNKERIAKMKKGAYLVNNARGAIADMIAVKEACESGHLGGKDFNSNSHFSSSIPLTRFEVQSYP